MRASDPKGDVSLVDENNLFQEEFCLKSVQKQRHENFGQTNGP